MDSFEKIAKALNTDFVQTENTSAIDNAISVIEAEKKEIMSVVNDKITLEDKEFLEEKIKTLVEMSMDAARKLHEDMKIGTSPRHYEAFSLLSNAIMSQLQELRVLNKTVADMQFMQGGNETNNDADKQNGNIMLSSGQLLSLIKDAKENSQMNAIDATFTVEESD